ncbi:hypothetical protein V6N13_085253 [Hibiscus sabdariffa]
MSSMNGYLESADALLSDADHEGYFEPADSLLSEVGPRRYYEDQCWWNKVLDTEEAKRQVFFSLPMIVSNVSFSSIILVSVMFAGQLGELQLAGATLANSWATVTGLAFMVRISFLLLLNSFHRAKRSFRNAVRPRIRCKNLPDAGNLPPIIVHDLLLLLDHHIDRVVLHRVDPDFASTRCPDFENRGSLHQVPHPGLIRLRFRSKHPPISSDAEHRDAAGLVLRRSDEHSLRRCIRVGELHRPGFQGSSVGGFDLAVDLVPFAIGLCVSGEGIREDVGRIFLGILSLPSYQLEIGPPFCSYGLMPHSELSTSLIAMCVNTEAIAYMVTYGLSATASTRVSNELGAGHPARAKNAMAVTLKLSILLALAIVLVLGFGHNIWAAFFSNSPLIISQFASMTPYLLISITIDSFQGVLSGVARGSGWQLLAAWVNMGTFYLIGMPISGILAFKLKLYAKPKVNFRQFSGYINVDSNAGRSLFYYFVEAEHDPLNQPLTIWLSGGPGCSSVGDSFVGVGPFITTNNAHGLKRNLHAWTKVSNVLFIDSPVGSGWSYSKTMSDYETGDSSTNDDLLAFLLEWFEKYPIFKYRDLYLGGIGYAGHFVPNFAKTLLQHNNESKNYEFNLKGLALGNPVLRLKLDILAAHELYASKGMIPKKLYRQILKHCFGIGEDNYSNNVAPWSESCRRPMRRSKMFAFNATSVADAKQRQGDFRRAPCDGKIEDLISGKDVTKIIDQVDMCIPFRTEFYFNIPAVQKALHGNRTLSRYPWMGCFPRSGLNYSLFDTNIDMLPTLKQILLQSVPITIFSGDEDGAIPTNGTLNHVKKLAKDMNLNLTKNEAWHHESKEGGWLYSYGDVLTFMSVKGANHHVPFSKPSQALFIFKNHVLNSSLSVKEQ